MTNLLVRGEVKVSRPVDDFPVGVVGLLGAERRPTDQALEHDSTDTPPIASKVVALAGEDFRCNVVRSTDSRVGELTARLAPCVDLVAVADSELNLVNTHRLAVCGLRARTSVGHELLVVRCVVLLVEASRETKISQLDVSTSIEENVVGFDITEKHDEYIVDDYKKRNDRIHTDE